MKNKKFFLFVVFTVLTAALFSQTSLKESVCLVAVGHVDYMNSGSGFLVSDSEGNQYIVSNDHVTQKSGTITVIFREEDGSMRRFENMVVLAYDALYDLSVLGFSMGRKINRQGLKIDIGKVANEEKVSAAGFPGLSWKFSEGVILENNTPAYRSGTVASFLTHTAFVDHGSSGGPLLRLQQNLHTGWAVIGVNTLKTENGPGHSIPSERIVGLLNAAAAKKTENRILARENGTREKAVQINFEDPVVSTAVKSPDHVGWYRFSADVEGDLEISLQSAESFKLELYDNSGKIVSSGVGSNCSFDAHVLSGDHYLKVTGDNLVYWTTYNISANFKTFPKNYEHSSAVSPVPAENGVWHSRVLHRNDEDWFSVNALPDKALVFETKGLIDSCFEVFDLTGTLLAEGGSTIASVDSYRWIYVPDKAAMPLLVRVTGYNKTMGTYNFRMFQASIAASNNTMENAVVITPHVPVTGSVKNAYDRSWFYFSLSRGTILNITIEGGNFSLELYDSGNNLISRDDFNNNLSVSMPYEEVFLCIKAVDLKSSRSNSFIVFSETD